VAGNTIGQAFRVTTWGESHGPALGVVIDGCPPGLPLEEADLAQALEQRQGRGLSSATSRTEPDAARILSGVFEGRTTGTPLSILIPNLDARPADYEPWRDVFRPGHADVTYQAKYGVRDHRGGGRASGRETAARVAAGEVARRVLEPAGMEVLACTLALGGIRAEVSRVDRAAILRSPLLCPCPQATERMLRLLDEVVAAGDSVGGIVQVVVRGCPAGLGEPVFDKLDAVLAAALMSLGTVKAVEVGQGLASADLRGSQVNDPITPTGFASNRAGGILGGISNGDDIVLRAACKPIPSISMEQGTVDRQGRATRIRVGGRHDACVLPRLVPVCEAMVAVVMADFLLRQRALTATSGWPWGRGTSAG